MHMKEIDKQFELCEFGLALLVKGLNHKGIFLAHINSIEYSNLARIFTLQKINENLGSPEIVVSSNVQCYNKLKESKGIMRQ